MHRPDANAFTADRRLRIGYVSRDFADHAVSRFLDPILANHDHERFHVTGYSHTTRLDEQTARFQSYCDEWREINGQSDNDVAAGIRNDSIDILVDLAGHTELNRLLLFARKPAPLQVTYLGYPNTTGLASIDLRIADTITDPVGSSDSFYTERLLRLPRVSWCFRPPSDAPAVLPADARGDVVTFVSFHNIGRLTPEVLTLWSQVIRSVPRSRLLIHRNTLNGHIAGRISAFLGKCGVAADRVSFVAQIPGSSHLAGYQAADILLDTFPWSGHTTACESLWMGVPVVTMTGNTHASRMVSSVLNAVGLDELVTSSPDQFVDVAAALAADIPRLRELRLTMRDRLTASPLLAGVDFVRKYESALLAAWADRCALANT